MISTQFFSTEANLCFSQTNWNYVKSNLLLLLFTLTVAVFCRYASNAVHVVWVYSYCEMLFIDVLTVKRIHFGIGQMMADVSDNATGSRQLSDFLITKGE